MYLSVIIFDVFHVYFVHIFLVLNKNTLFVIYVSKINIYLKIHYLGF